MPTPTLGKSFRSLTRLVIGAAAYGYDSLTNHIPGWEKAIAEANETSQEGGEIELRNAEIQRFPASDAEMETRRKQERSRVDLPAEEDETEVDRIRYAVIGMTVGIQENLERSLDLADRATRLASSLAAPIVGAVYESRLLAPVRRNFESLVTRGETKVHRWVETGRSEEAYDRALVKTAWFDQVDNSVDYLAADTNVQELVQSQGVGLADKVVEEARERSVSADNYLEATVRAMLRRPPHAELPEPPEQVKKVVAPLRRIGSKVVRKP